jgi:hypothetical protein
MTIRKSFGYTTFAILLSIGWARPLLATWSIGIADSNTKEVALAKVTCLSNIDLFSRVPVVVVGKGAGAAQAVHDVDGQNRLTIFNGLMAGTDPAVILADLTNPTNDTLFAFRQYGIVDTQDRRVTYTGIYTSQWAGGVVGAQETMSYAIQGNILTGSCVVSAIEQAVLNTVGDVPAKLMAGMQVARAQGGDGRCSCSQTMPESCGCPPASFEKSGHIGGMIVARIGDMDDPVCNANGCADGSYFMQFNVANQLPTDPDPVTQLQGLYDAWRTGLTGRPDAVQSTVTGLPATWSPEDSESATMTITLRDWSGDAVTAPIQSVVVTHVPGSSGSSPIGPVEDNGDGTYSVPIGPPTTFGLDRLRVTVNDGIRPVILMPEAAVLYPPSAVPVLAWWGLGLTGTLLLGAGAFQLRPKASVGGSRRI